MAKTRRPLISERDIRRAVKTGLRSIDGRGAMITPSARDLAHALGVAIVVDGEPAPSSPPQASTSGAVAKYRIAVGADHGGVAMKDAVVALLRGEGHSVTDHGTTSSEPVDYPDFAVAVAQAVASEVAEIGIMIDGAGIGSCMAANKISGVRAALCYDLTTAKNAREHNNANVLTLGGGLIGTRLATEIVSTFVTTPFGAGRHAARVAKIDALDAARRSVAGGPPRRER